MDIEAEVVENLRKLRGVGHGNIVVELAGVRSQENPEVSPGSRLLIQGSRFFNFAKSL